MDALRDSLIPFLTILNPLALCLYLTGVMEDLERKDFARVLAWACLISLLTFWVFAAAGEPLLIGFFGIHTSALRMFGGVIFFVLAYNYVVKGYRTAEMLRGSLDELPSAIALPFMIGAGTLTQSIFIGERHPTWVALVVILIGIAISYGIVFAFKLVRDHMRGARERIFDRYVNILVRVNGLLIGAISTEMVVSSLRDLYGTPVPSGG